MNKTAVFIVGLLVSAGAMACNFHERSALSVPNHPAIMLTIPSIDGALEDGRLPEMNKPDAMVNWQLAQKLSKTIPAESITFYQVIEGHYSSITGNAYRWLGEYASDTRPALGELMILSELVVFSAILDKQITVEQALEERWITVNGPREEREAVKQWLVAYLK